MDKALDIAAIEALAASSQSLDFDLLVREHQQRIYRVLLGLVRDPEVADNLTQECFVCAYEKRASFRGEARVGTWLISIAINLARDHARNRRAAFWRRLFATPAEEARAAFDAAADLGASPERRLIACDQVAQVWRIVAELPPRRREAFLLRFVEELSIEEIALVLGTEVGTAKAHVFHAVATVRQRMRKIYGPEKSTGRR